MSFIYNEFKRMLAEGEIDWSNDSTRFVLVMTDTTCDTEIDANTMGGFTAIDYCDGTNHNKTAGQIIANPTVTEDATNNRVELDGDNYTISSLGAGTRSNKALVLFHWDTNIGSSIPIAYIDQGGFPFNGDGTDLVVTWSDDGIIGI
jgi:hypothetical protein